MTSRAVPHTRHNMVAGPSRADRPRHIQLPTFDQSDLPVDLSPESLDDPTSIFYISRNKAARPSTDLGHRPGAHKRAQSNPSPLALADSTPSPPLKTAGMLSRVWGSFREKKKANQAQDSQLDVIVSPSSQVSPPTSVQAGRKSEERGLDVHELGYDLVLALNSTSAAPAGAPAVNNARATARRSRSARDMTVSSKQRHDTSAIALPVPSTSLKRSISSGRPLNKPRVRQGAHKPLPPLPQTLASSRRPPLVHSRTVAPYAARKAPFRTNTDPYQVPSREVHHHQVDVPLDVNEIDEALDTLVLADDDVRASPSASAFQDVHDVTKKVSGTDLAASTTTIRPRRPSHKASRRGASLARPRISHADPVSQECDLTQDIDILMHEVDTDSSVLTAPRWPVSPSVFSFDFNKSQSIPGTPSPGGPSGARSFLNIDTAPPTPVISSRPIFHSKAKVLPTVEDTVVIVSYSAVRPVSTTSVTPSELSLDSTTASSDTSEDAEVAKPSTPSAVGAGGEQSLVAQERPLLYRGMFDSPRDAEWDPREVISWDSDDDE